MILKVDTPNGTIRYMVYNTYNAVQVLKSLSAQSIRCVRWEIEDDKRGIADGKPE